MLTKILICMLVMLHPLTKTTTEQDLLDNYEDYCGDLDYRQVTNFNDKLQDYREDRSNEYYNDQRIVVQDLSQKRRRKIIDLTIAPFILLVIYISLTFLVLVGFLLACFNVIKIERKKICLTIAIILFLMVLTLFIIGVIFSATSSHYRPEAYCYLYKIQVAALLGTNNEQIGEGFIGFRTLTATTSKFAEEIQNIEDNQNLYTPLIQADFVGTTETTFNKLLNFVDVNQNKTPNSTGQMQLPISNANLNPAVNPQIESEFIQLHNLGQTLTNMANLSKKFQSNVYSNQMNLLLRSLSYNFLQSEALLTNMLLGEGYLTKFDGHIKKGGRTTVYSTIPLLVLFLFAIIFGFSKKSRKVGYFIMIIACLVLITIALGYIFWIFGIAEVSGVCGIVREINRGNTDIITNLGGSQTLKSFADSCIVQNSKSDYITKDLPNSESLVLFNDYVEYMEGLKLYQIFIENDQMNSKAIPPQKQQWEKIVQGLQVDHNQAQQTLEKFNEEVSCNGENFGFTKQSCSDSDCKSILETNTYSSPSCVSDQAAVNAQFVNLKNYIEGAVNNAKKLQTEIGKINEDQTPNGAFTSSNEFIKSYQSNIQSVQDLHKDSFGSLSNKFSFKYSLDCSVFQADSLRLEYVGCYKFAYWGYTAIITWSVLIILAFFFLLTMCWALGYSDEEEKEQEEEEEYTPDPQKFYTNQADDIDVDDNEKIPFS